MGVYRGRVVLIDDDECRAPVVVAWLALMGMEVAWLSGVSKQWGELNRLARHASIPKVSALPVCALETALDSKTLCLDARPSMQCRAGHLPGVRWVNRSLLAEQLTDTEPYYRVVIIGDSLRVACLASDIEALGFTQLERLEDDVEAWKTAGISLRKTPNEPDDNRCIDFLFFVHDRHDGNLEALRRYLAWKQGCLLNLILKNDEPLQSDSKGKPGFEVHAALNTVLKIRKASYASSKTENKRMVWSAECRTRDNGLRPKLQPKGWIMLSL